MGASPPDSATSRNGTPSTRSFFDPGSGPRVMVTDLTLRMGLFILPLPTPVQTGSGSKGFAGLRSQPRRTRHPWEAPSIPSAAPGAKQTPRVQPRHWLQPVFGPRIAVPGGGKDGLLREIVKAA